MIRDKFTDPKRAHQEVDHPALMEALIQATEQLLAEHGPQGVTALRIATKAGVSLTAMFQCFRNKDVIVAEALARRRQRMLGTPRNPGAAPVITRKRVETPPAPPARRAPPPPPATSLFRNPPPPPSSSLFRKPATAPKARADSEPPPAVLRLPDRRAAPPPVAPPPAPPPRESLEDAIALVVRALVAKFAQLLPSMTGMAQADKDAINRMELRRMAQAFTQMLEDHGIPDPGHVAHVMTLSCDKVLKDAIRNAPQSITDGRLEGALCRLCVDFVGT
ncbi:helix-turn-helix domain-containing protein [Paraliomyxa miuraensis]|uniref:helix-turn-helix domain-containing protein n=1 Tax=Paraliomyxa miuraensis TaxID=376150 RepID=UPI0022527D9B|nr:helix-turn-helix domain-containing protein [Paraliomyxa miuraensis]MCX4239792.1 TetR/AcrR family transcriptional regulator [Paraliomyxa miuraensis]